MPPLGRFTSTEMNASRRTPAAPLAGLTERTEGWEGWRPGRPRHGRGGRRTGEIRGGEESAALQGFDGESMFCGGSRTPHAGGGERRRVSQWAIVRMSSVGYGRSRAPFLGVRTRPHAGGIPEKRPRGARKRTVTDSEFGRRPVTARARQNRPIRAVSRGLIKCGRRAYRTAPRRGNVEREGPRTRTERCDR